MALTAITESTKRVLLDQSTITSIYHLVRNTQLCSLISLAPLTFHVFSVEAQVATSLTILGAWVGSMTSSGPCERYGMRVTLLWNAVFFVAGSVMTASGNVLALFIGRLVSG